MKNLFNKVKKFLHDLFVNSYGMDDLNRALIIGAFALTIINIIFRSNLIITISDIFFALFLFRYLSSNKAKRAAENKKFLGYFKLYQLKWKYRKTHKIFKCKKCKQIIRVPKDQGKIEVTCPSCGNIEIHHS